MERSYKSLYESKVSESPDVVGFVKEAKRVLPKEDMHVHDSDLYVAVSDASTKLLRKYHMFGNPLLSTFVDNIDGRRTYDIPFGNLFKMAEGSN